MSKKKLNKDNLDGIFLIAFGKKVFHYKEADISWDLKLKSAWEEVDEDNDLDKTDTYLPSITKKKYGVFVSFLSFINGLCRFINRKKKQ